MIPKKKEEKELSKLYQNLKQTASIADDELNIEGAIFCNEKWHLFQRGNRANVRNGIFKTKSLEIESQTEFIKIPLPKIKHVETSFTDAILVDDKIYFLATAEDTTSTYDDGEILGSLLGRMDSKTLEVEFPQKQRFKICHFRIDRFVDAGSSKTQYSRNRTNTEYRRH